LRPGPQGVALTPAPGRRSRRANSTVARRYDAIVSGRIDRLCAALVFDARNAIFHIVVNVGIGSVLVPQHLRRAMYRRLGFQILGATIFPHATFKTNKVEIGDHVYINEGCRFDNHAWVKVGDNVAVGQEVMFLTSSHQAGRVTRRAGQLLYEPITIGPACWIGARATILAGVTVGEGCLVAAGAVVTTDCAPHGLYGGVPARRLRELA
jgi:maltose O-acetyltransferase